MNNELTIQINKSGKVRAIDNLELVQFSSNTVLIIKSEEYLDSCYVNASTSTSKTFATYKEYDGEFYDYTLKLDKWISGVEVPAEKLKITLSIYGYKKDVNGYMQTVCSAKIPLILLQSDEDKEFSMSYNTEDVKNIWIQLGKINNELENNANVVQEINDSTASDVRNVPSVQAVIDITTNANEKATQAVNTANAANATANNINGIASQALSVAERANEKAYNAVVVANNASGIASQALSVADGANTKADNAVVVANNATADIALKQNKTDNTLQTTSKNVVGAINELNSRQVVSNYSFQDYNAMIFDVLNSAIGTYKVGDNFLLINNGSGSNYEPDRWCSELAETKYETITPLANGQIGVGYYILATISGDKPDITNMVTTDTDQTITGAKDFTGGLSVNTINIATQADVETLNTQLSTKQDAITSPTKTSDLDNDSGFQNATQVNALIETYLTTNAYSGSSTNL